MQTALLPRARATVLLVSTVLKLDYDAPVPVADLRARLALLGDLFGVAVWRIVRTRSSSGGVHITASSEAATLSPVEIVAAQAVCGSDWKREALNLARTRVLSSARLPAMWRARWNVLYDRKYPTALRPIGGKEPESREGDVAKVNAQDYSKQRPKLTPEMVKGAATVLHIQTVEHLELDQDGETRPKIILIFEEFPEHAYWLNVTGIKNLIARLGDESDEWEGEAVPMEKVKTTNPQTKKPQDALWIVDPAQWEDYLSQYRKVTKATGAGRGKAAAKRGARARR